MRQLIRYIFNIQEEQVEFGSKYCHYLHLLICFSFFWLLFPTGPLSAQKNIDFSQLVNRTHTERTVALMDYYRINLLVQDSATSFNQIARVRQLAADHNDEDLMLEADLMEAHYYAYRYHPSSPLITEVMTSLIAKAKKMNALWLHSRAESLHATRYFDTSLYALAFKHFSIVVNLLEHEDPKEYPIKLICLFLLGDLHFHFREYEQAIHMFQRAVDNQSEHDMEYYTFLVHNALGLSYRHLNKLDSSDMWFQITYAKAKEKNNTLWQSVCLGNIGENHYLKGNYSAAIPLLQQDAENAIKNNTNGNASNALSLLGDIYLELGEIHLAERYLHDALYHAHRSTEYRRLKVVFPKLVKLYAAQNKPDLVNMYLDSIFIVEDSLERVFDRLILSRAQQSLELESIARETTRLEAERRRQLVLRNSIIATLMLVVIIVLLLFNRHRIKQQSKQKSILEQKKLTEANLQLANVKLQDFVKTVQLKNAELERSKKELERLTTVGPSEENMEYLEELQNATILTDEDWENFKELFDRVYPGYMTRLEQKHPDLSFTEARFMALQRMNIPSKQMTSMLGVGDNAIRQYRLRLRARLGISPSDDLQAIVESI